MSSFLAQCPHCLTSFRVSTPQLDAAGGMVRCGACLGVFSAPANRITVRQPHDGRGQIAADPAAEENAAALEIDYRITLNYGSSNLSALHAIAELSPSSRLSTPPLPSQGVQVPVVGITALTEPQSDNTDSVRPEAGLDDDIALGDLNIDDDLEPFNAIDPTAEKSLTADSRSSKQGHALDQKTNAFDRDDGAFAADPLIDLPSMEAPAVFADSSPHASSRAPTRPESDPNADYFVDIKMPADFAVEQNNEKLNARGKPSAQDTGRFTGDAEYVFADELEPIDEFGSEEITALASAPDDAEPGFSALSSNAATDGKFAPGVAEDHDTFSAQDSKPDTGNGFDLPVLDQKADSFAAIDEKGGGNAKVGNVAAASGGRNASTRARTDAAPAVAAPRGKRGRRPAVDHDKEALREYLAALEDEEALEPLGTFNLDAVHDEPVTLRSAQTVRGRTLTLAAACLGILLLLQAGLFMVDRNFDTLVADPRFSALLPIACAVLECPLPERRSDLSSLYSQDLLIRSHPRYSSALEVSFIFRNDALTPQPFPAIELGFSNNTNRVLINRLFQPDEYLPPELSKLDEMPAQSSLQISLEIADPGSDAMNYTLAFREP